MRQKLLADPVGLEVPVGRAVQEGLEDLEGLEALAIRRIQAAHQGRRGRRSPADQTARE